MSYSENGNGTNFTMPVQPYGGNGGWGNGSFFGDGAWWLIILLLFAGNGWGNGFGFGGGGMMPWMMSSNTNNDVQRGFDQSAIMGALNGITGALSNGFANAEISRQNCCCENRAGLADLKYTVATENCADRTALNEGFTNMLMANNANTQAIVNATNAGIQTVMDKICQLELAGKDQQIANLTAALNDANRRAESKDEIAQIMAGQRALANEVEQYVLPTPRPAYVVQNPNCCAQNTGCGCMG